MLLHGAYIDVRWRAPVHAGQSLTASAQASKVSIDRILFDFRVERDDAVAMVGSAVVPLAAGPKL